MYEVDNVMIPNSLFVDLYLKLIMSHQLENSLWNVLIYDQKSSSCRQNFCLIHAFFEILAWLLIAFFEVGLLGFRSFNREIFVVILKRMTQSVGCCATIQEKTFEAIRDITLSLAMIDLERRINADFISIFLVCPVRKQLKDDLLRKFLFQLYFKSADT